MVDRTSTAADRALVCFLTGCILAVVGFYRVAWTALPLSGPGLLDAVLKALLGMLIGYTLGIPWGIYFARNWPIRHWSLPILCTMTSYAAAVIAIILLQGIGNELTQSMQLWLYILIPPTALALALRQISYRVGHPEALWAVIRDKRRVEMDAPSILWRKLAAIGHWRALGMVIIPGALLLPILGMYREYHACVSLRATAYGDILFGSYAMMRIAVGFCTGAIPAVFVIAFYVIASSFRD